MSVWMLALLAWVVVFPAVVLAAAVTLSKLLGRGELHQPERGPLAEVIPLAPVRRRRAALAAGRRPLVRSDQRAPVA